LARQRWCRFKVAGWGVGSFCEESLRARRLAKIEVKKEAGLQVKEEDGLGEAKKYIQKIDFHDYASSESVDSS
jgi:hypothetical protein